MFRGVLLDEHLHEFWRDQLPDHYPALRLNWVGGSSAPPRGTPDPELLVWCEENDFYLLTDNRRSMPAHLREHVLAGRHIPGVFRVHPELNIKTVAEQLQLIIEASLPDEYRDTFAYLPL